MKNFILFTTLMSLSTGVTFAREFGSNGRSGANGRDGSDGANGRDIVVRADGQPQYFDFSGADGGSGSGSSSGESAYNCTQPRRDTENVYGASGGNGGRSGDGGSGGDAGNVTVYFDNIDNLAYIVLRGLPGKGGSGVRYRSEGGRGCRCNYSSWESHGRFYTCTPGQDGRPGQSGRDGSSGSYGRVTLISQLTPVQPDLPSVSFDMTEMLTKTANLGKNLWEQRQGANALFARRSEINDSYTIFVKRVSAVSKFAWGVNKPLSDFRGVDMNVHLEGDQIKVDLPSNIWHESTVTDVGGEKLYTFNKVLYEDDAFKIDYDSRSGSSQDLVVSLQDDAKVSDMLKTNFKVEFYTEENGSYYQRFTGVIPEQLVTASAEEIKVAIGKLAIDSQYLASGTSVYMKLYAERSLGDNKGTVVIKKFFEIP